MGGGACTVIGCNASRGGGAGSALPQARVAAVDAWAAAEELPFEAVIHFTSSDAIINLAAPWKVMAPKTSTGTGFAIGGNLPLAGFEEFLVETWGFPLHVEFSSELGPMGLGGTQAIAWVGRTVPAHFVLRALRDKSHIVRLPQGLQEGGWLPQEGATLGHHFLATVFFKVPD
mgnify:CR=1 FL=1